MMTLKVGKALGRWGAVWGLLLAGLWVGGCRTQSQGFGEVPGLNQGGASSPAGASASVGSDKIQPGETLTFTFADLPQLVPAIELRVKDDGKITLLLNEIFDAVGKTRGELEQEIRARYVPTYYKYLTVTIKAQERFYYVGGEVKGPNRYLYSGTITLTKAIQSAGDFTDFANKKKVKLIRGKRTQTFNCNKIIDHPEQDPEILPGDKVHVPRRHW
jgi:protein involved in polysaccharide export with SLBB domain